MTVYTLMKFNELGLNELLPSGEVFESITNERFRELLREDGIAYTDICEISNGVTFLSGGRQVRFQQIGYEPKKRKRQKNENPAPPA